MRIADVTFVVADTETTGVRADTDRIIEIGAVKVRGGEIVGRFDTLVNPGRHVPHRITDLTGITTAAVFQAPPAAEALPAFRDFLGDDVLVAHNLTFDQRFLDAEFRRLGRPVLANPTLCTLRLARRVLRALGSRSLDALKAFYGIKTPRRHRAGDDAEATAQILIHLLTSLTQEFELETLDELLTFQHQRYKAVQREPKHLDRIRAEVLPHIPERPGVYFHLNAKGDILYIGKAKQLRSRVRSYFTGVAAHPPRTRKLLNAVRDVRWEETGSELAALLLESRLIKQHQPPFNRALRRYRNRPFIRLAVHEPFPRVSWTLYIANDGARYFGPLRGRREAEQLVELIGRMFKLRECDDPTFEQRRACMYAGIGRCEAPCVDADAASRYGAQVAQVEALLRGEDRSVLAHLERGMREAATRMDFEQAAVYRDQHRRFERTLGQRERIAAPLFDHHGVLVQEAVEPGVRQLYVIRYGRLAETIAYRGGGLETPLRARLRALLDGDEPPPERYHREEIDEVRILANWIYHHREEAEHLLWRTGGDFEAYLARLEAALEGQEH